MPLNKETIRNYKHLLKNTLTHTHRHTLIYMCVCVCGTQSEYLSPGRFDKLIKRTLLTPNILLVDNENLINRHKYNQFS